MSQFQIKHLSSSTLTLTLTEDWFCSLSWGEHAHGMKIMYWKGVSLITDKREMTVGYSSVEGGALSASP